MSRHCTEFLSMIQTDWISYLVHNKNTQDFSNDVTLQVHINLVELIKKLVNYRISEEYHILGYDAV
jgi:hypothetical protein